MKLNQIPFQAAKENDIKKLQANDKFVEALKIYRDKLNEVYEQIEKEIKINKNQILQSKGK